MWPVVLSVLTAIRKDNHLEELELSLRRVDHTVWDQIHLAKLADLDELITYERFPQLNHLVLKLRFSRRGKWDSYKPPAMPVTRDRGILRFMEWDAKDHNMVVKRLGLGSSTIETCSNRI
jgi:hypothetical protein